MVRDVGFLLQSQPKKVYDVYTVTPLGPSAYPAILHRFNNP